MKSLYKYLFLIILTQISYGQSMNFDMLHGINNPNLVGDSIKLERRTFNAFRKMEKAALMDGIELKIVSAYRSYDRQKSIWNMNIRNIYFWNFNRRHFLANRLLQKSDILDRKD